MCAPRPEQVLSPVKAASPVKTDGCIGSFTAAVAAKYLRLLHTMWLFATYAACCEHALGSCQAAHRCLNPVARQAVAAKVAASSVLASFQSKQALHNLQRQRLALPAVTCPATGGRQARHGHYGTACSGALSTHVDTRFPTHSPSTMHSHDMPSAPPSI